MRMWFFHVQVEMQHFHANERGLRERQGLQTQDGDLGKTA
jgi:hypothetical protein